MTTATFDLRRDEKPANATFLTAAHSARWMATFLWIGIAARSVRFLLRFPLWEDECFLCVNFIDRGFADLLSPLTYHQVAPPLFLWLERAAVLTFGYSEWSLRLVPFVAAVAGLFLFRRLATQFLTGPALLLAFGCFAVAYPAIRYAAEAKQYSTDLFAALLLLCIAVEWHRVRRPFWLWVLAALAAPLLWLSYPAAFVVGGVSLAIGVALFSEVRGQGPRASEESAVRPSTLRRFISQLSTLNPQLAIAWAAYNVAVLVGFGTLFFVIRRQSGAELGFMTEYWRVAFPPLSEPARLPAWLLEVHTSDLLAWPVGGGRGASAFTAVLAAIGFRQLVRKRDPFWGLLLLAPAGLNILAAAMQRYPYGGHFKFSMYLGPAVCLLAGCGAAAWNAKLAKSWPKLARGAMVGTVAVLALVAGITMARDVLNPYKTLSDERARAFARWFWFNAEAEGDVEVVDAHDGKVFSSDAYAELSWTAMFLCNRAIYSPTMHDGHATPIPLTETRPLRCVVYRDPRFEFDEAARDAWLDEMQREHDLAATETYPFTRFGKGERDFRQVDYLDIYTFRPKPVRTATAARAVWK
ncbi:MAG: glycosyltransferase family 39 protein [Planctomycetaceae bacterium]|nr:glycosyltransferase family 39 protein [Planctomycetaceae bacterium]